MTIKRASGLLLHITSLPSKYGIGDFGPEARRFADFLARAKQRYWQMLPLNPPTLRQNPYSPYNSISAFAGNWLLISPDLLYRQGFLSKRDIQDCPGFEEAKVDYPMVISYKTGLLNAAYERFKNSRRRQDYERFCIENAGWLEDFAVFAALRKHFQPRLWRNWPAELRTRREKALISAKTDLKETISREKFLQYLFFSQWFALKRYCNRLGIEIIGDIPIYVAYDSADVWGHPEIFKLDRCGNPEFVSGVPPDLFSRTGQLWGNPTYNWPALKKTNYSWWLQRIEHNLKMFDRVRIDHFRGFFRYWQVPAPAAGAKNGKWMKGPADDFFNVLFKRFSPGSFIAEDLGYITNDIKTFIKKHGLTGMKVLQFAFDPPRRRRRVEAGGDPDENTHYPRNHTRNSVVYTGTHDNNTAVGWFKKEATKEQKARLFDCLGRKVSAHQIHWELINLALASVANLAVIPVQDILGLDGRARMNRPSTIRGNWRWRLASEQLTPQIAKKLATLTENSGRH